MQFIRQKMIDKELRKLHDSIIRQGTGYYYFHYSFRGTNLTSIFRTCAYAMIGQAELIVFLYLIPWQGTKVKNGIFSFLERGIAEIRFCLLAITNIGSS